MGSLIHYTNCPVCNATGIHPVLKVKDQTVSGEIFDIWECNDCGLRFTQDVPDENAIARYYQSKDYISHTETSKGLINRLYLSVRKTTLKKKRNLVSVITGLKQGKILDLGSGTGAFMSEMEKNGWQAIGLEPSDEAREVARKTYGVQLKTNDELLSLPANSFDAITTWHVLEHVHQLHQTIQQLRSLLKENGRLIIAVPNYTSLDAKLYKENWAAYDPPRHLYHFSPRSMKILIEKNGMKILQYKPMWFDSYYVSLLSSKNKTGKTNWVAAVWNGFRSNFNAIGNKKKCSSIIYVIAKDH
jgi:2-polyprenyl-3-methyl-5-hydroxy-6-metoxy-1,4-benzoquinol methylase